MYVNVYITLNYTSLSNHLIFVLVICLIYNNNNIIMYYSIIHNDGRWALNYCPLYIICFSLLKICGKKQIVFNECHTTNVEKTGKNIICILLSFIINNGQNFYASLHSPRTT